MHAEELAAQCDQRLAGGRIDRKGVEEVPVRKTTDSVDGLTVETLCAFGQSASKTYCKTTALDLRLVIQRI